MSRQIDSVEAQAQGRRLSRPIVLGAMLFGVLIAPTLALSYENPVADFEQGGTINADDFNTIFADIYGALNELEGRLTGVISENTTWTVGAGADYETLAEAVDATTDFRFAPNATLTIDIADGSYTLADSIEVVHPQGAQIRIVGNDIDPSAVTLNCAADTPCFVLNDGQALKELEGVTLNSTGSAAAVLVSAAGVRLTSVHFDGGGSAIIAQLQATIFGDALDIDNVETGVRARDGSSVRLIDSSISNASLDGVWAERGATVTVNTLSVTSAGRNGVSVTQGARVALDSLTLNTITSHGLLVADGAGGFVRDLSCTGVTSDCVNVGAASTLAIEDMQCAKGNNCVEAHSQASVNVSGILAVTNADQTAFNANHAGVLHVIWGQLTYNGSFVTGFDEATEYVQFTDGVVYGNEN